MTYELHLSGKHAAELGLIALIDDDDVELVSGHSWSAQKFRSADGRYYFYAGAKIGGKNTLLHRFLLDAKKGELVDHRNGVTLDCRRRNIRKCTHAENMRNRKVMRNSTTGIKGIFFYKKKGLYRARIKVDGKCIHLGYHKTAELAKAAYDEAALRLHGEFARLA